MAELAAAGVDFDDVTATLEREGVDSFSASFHDAFATLGEAPRRGELTRSAVARRAARRRAGGRRGRRRVACAFTPLVFGITYAGTPPKPSGLRARRRARRSTAAR